MNSRDHGIGAIFTCDSLSIALIRARSSVFISDSHSRNKEGYQDANGKRGVLRIFILSNIKKLHSILL